MSRKPTYENWDELTAREIQQFCEVMAESSEGVRDNYRRYNDADSYRIAGQAHARAQAFWTVRNMIEDALFKDEPHGVSE